MASTRKKKYSDHGSLQEILTLEKGAQKKKWKGLLPVALIFPNTYRVGMANLGFQTIYSLLNKESFVVCERFFLTDSRNGSPRSLESNRSLQDFPIIFCSVSFEQDYPSFLKILHDGGILLRAKHRLEEDPGTSCAPLIVCGGAAVMINPEPIAPFVDVFFLGEAEPVLPEIVQFLAEDKGLRPREIVLEEIALKWKCCYVPQFYSVKYAENGIIEEIGCRKEGINRPRKSVLEETDVAGHSSLISKASEFADIFLVELGRGCTRGCRFCAAGFVYRPPRLWSPKAILAALSERPPDVKRIGLLGMEMIDPDSLKLVRQYILEQGCSLSFSSLRADILDGPLVDLLEKSGLKTATIAPDGFSERLRRVINKGLSKEDIVNGAEKLAKAGVRNIKLYFMTGLPTETENDWQEAVGLVEDIRNVVLAVSRPRGWAPTLTLSVNAFVPKPWTPFQYHPFSSLAYLRDALRFLRKELLHLGNITINAEQPEKTLFQAVLARGDRRVADGLERMVDGKRWRRALREAGIDPVFYAMRKRDGDEIFPWEVIDHGVNKKYLRQEYERALQGKITEPCLTEKCKRCGICNT